MATVTKEFRGCRDGSSIVETFRPGDQIEGDIARVAVKEGWATDGKPAPAKAADAPEKADAGEKGDDAGAGDKPAKPKGGKK